MVNNYAEHSGWMQTIQNKIQGQFKDISRTLKKNQGHEKMISSLKIPALFDTILFGLKQFTFLIKSCFRLGLGSVLDNDAQSPSKSTDHKIF